MKAALGEALALVAVAGFSLALMLLLPTDPPPAAPRVAAAGGAK